MVDTQGLLLAVAVHPAEHGTLGRLHVCAGRDGGNILPDVLSRRCSAIMKACKMQGAFNKILKSCGIQGIRFHDLRHTHATLLPTSGVPVHVVSAPLGHARIQTTVDTYGHVIPASDVETGKAIEGKVAAWRLQNVCRMLALVRK